MTHLFKKNYFMNQYLDIPDIPFLIFIIIYINIGIYRYIYIFGTI